MKSFANTNTLSNVNIQLITSEGSSDWKVETLNRCKIYIVNVEQTIIYMYNKPRHYSKLYGS